MSELTSKPVLLYGGLLQICGYPEDLYFQNQVKFDGSGERLNLRLLSATIKEGATVLDVGGNLGYTMAAIHQLNRSGRILVFEPVKTTFAALSETKRQNGIANAEIFDFGLSNESASSVMALQATNAAGAHIDRGYGSANVASHMTETVEVRALDEVYQMLEIDRCDFLKVDIEGHEPQFLEGAQNFIARFKPEALIECFHWCLNGVNRTSLADFVDQLFEHFPEVFGIDDIGYLDLSDPESRLHFTHDNIVHNKYLNVYAGFDRSNMIGTLESTYHNFAVSLDKDGKLSDFETRLAEYENRLVDYEISLAHYENSRAHRLTSRATKFLYRFL